jgi:hypothetical protein
MSDEQQTEQPRKGWPKGKPRKPITVTSRADAALTNSVLARRLGGNVFGAARQEIPLKDAAQWYTRWENTLVNPQQFYEMVHELGYVNVHKDDLAGDAASVGVQLSPEGYVCRGSGAQLEMLFKMPIADRRALEAAQTEQNNTRIGKGSAKGTRHAITEAASAGLGDEAASFLSKMPGQVIDTITDGEAQ